MKFDGMTWRRSRTVVTLPEYDGVHVQFGKICDKGEPGAIKTDYTYIGSDEPIYAIKIEGTGYGLTNKMYGRNFVRDGKVRVKAYLALNGRVYTTSWIHWEKTAKRQMEKGKHNG